MLNKPPVKTLQINGVTFDCIDIHKQPAFDHPLLINHTIQMRPSSFSEEKNHRSTSSNSLLEKELQNEECPPGTVIIRRTKKEDLINAKHFFSKVIKVTSIPPKDDIQDTSPQLGQSHYAGYIAHGKFHGAKGNAAVYGFPGLLSSQVSSVYVIVSNGLNDALNAAQAGWSVNPSLYGDDRTHLNILWTTDGYNKKGCFDLTCPGFVQVHKSTTPGFVFPRLSTYNGVQYEVPLSISKDQQSGNWWLMIGPNKTPIGSSNGKWSFR
ncbi:hypothetical protein QJS04_geneDACA016204 [Acorus gramineus]|uniref:Neprosin PEP catalytic domain-containing protein n=1 Tax=Acorus gramineus TaxID=55184 RepID=A0AAV9B611_ACOGR|nr:hypothetical protein QJS04_geneDACA016204 [Acorus gramineus]